MVNATHLKTTRNTGQPGKPSRDPAAVLATSSFNTGLMLLPAGLRQDARKLYCLLRSIDDLVDENHPEADRRVAAIETWATQGRQDTPETRTLTLLAERYPLSPETLMEFCAGMRHDLARRTIQTEADLERYCHQVAGTVGVMLAALLGTTHAAGIEKMATLGRAMQRTNILRDIDEDLENGRLYIPQSAIDKHGFPYPGAREALLREQIAHADALYERGSSAIPLLIEGRQAMTVATAQYREILRQIERDGYGQHPGRTTVPAWRKRLLATQHTRAQLTAADRKATRPRHKQTAHQLGSDQ